MKMPLGEHDSFAPEWKEGKSTHHIRPVNNYLGQVKFKTKLRKYNITLNTDTPSFSQSAPATPQMLFIRCTSCSPLAHQQIPQMLCIKLQDPWHSNKGDAQGHRVKTFMLILCTQPQNKGGYN